MKIFLFYIKCLVTSIHTKYIFPISIYGTNFTLPDYPELDIVYVGSMNSLCPSQYDSTILCFWEGNITCTLSIGHEVINLDTIKKEPIIYQTDTDTYSFTQSGPYIENKFEIHHIYKLMLRNVLKI